MGKNAQKRRGDTQPKIDHFIMSADSFIAIRRYLGSQPHDATRDMIMHLEQMPAVTVDDIQKREKQGARLAELEALAIDAEDVFPDGDPLDTLPVADPDDEPTGAIVDNPEPEVAEPDEEEV